MPAFLQLLRQAFDKLLIKRVKTIDGLMVGLHLHFFWLLPWKLHWAAQTSVSFTLAFIHNNPIFLFDLVLQSFIKEVRHFLLESCEVLIAEIDYIIDDSHNKVVVVAVGTKDELIFVLIKVVVLQFIDSVDFVCSY